MKTIKQAMIKSETEVAVDEYLQSINVKFDVFVAGVGLKRDEWECDGWRVQLSKTGVIEQFDYYTGIGRRAIAGMDKIRIDQDYKGSKYHAHHLAAKAKPFAPFAASVLYSLTMDSNGCQQNFKSWCDEYGYDNDSLKARNIYDACCENAEKLLRVFNREQIAHITTLLEDY